MKHLVFLLLLSLFFVSCQTAEKPFLSNYLNKGNLTQQSFTINPDADTTLISSGGAKIRIGKGTFPLGKPVTIEWKEALDFQSIMRAGLTTQAGKELLRSGGMFYFNTKEKLDIQKPIGIDVPTETIASGMQLYKGDSSEGKLDRKDPKPIENIKAFGENKWGKKLFDNNCASCHSIDKDLTGPALANFKNRGPWKDKQKYYEWMHDPAGFMATDAYTRCLKCSYGIIQQAFPGLEPGALDSISKYIQDETERLGLSEKVTADNCDSCIAYHSSYDSLINLRNQLFNSNNNSIDVNNKPPNTQKIISGGGSSTTRSDVSIEQVAPVDLKTDYYRVEISTEGWYNIDALLKDYDGYLNSKLIVRMQGAYATKQEVYLAIPSIKVLVQGGHLANGKDIGFYEKNGNIPLPQNIKAFIFSMGEEKGNFYYSQADFIISTSQTITLAAEKISREEFDQKTKSLEGNGLKIKSDTTIHFNNLKSVDEQLEKMKNDKLKGCGCRDYPQEAPDGYNTVYDYVQGVNDKVQPDSNYTYPSYSNIPRNK